MAWLIDQHLEGEHPGCNVIMVTVTDDESRRIEQQSDHETAAEIKAVPAAMFQTQIPDVFNIFVPRWGERPAVSRRLLKLAHRRRHENI
jgi:hypothetical protein